MRLRTPWPFLSRAAESYFRTIIVILCPALFVLSGYKALATKAPTPRALRMETIRTVGPLDFTATFQPQPNGEA